MDNRLFKRAAFRVGYSRSVLTQIGVCGYGSEIFISIPSVGRFWLKEDGTFAVDVENHAIPGSDIHDFDRADLTKDEKIARFRLQDNYFAHPPTPTSSS